MTDPRSRRPEFWRNFAWTFAVAAAVGVTAGIVLLLLGSPSGWINVLLGALIGFQSFTYFRAYRRTRHERDRGGRE
ncbi:uncharacterized membrane protein YhaH (DUF805 family) [Leifsonia sp. 1010]|nr:uncharacterized membrane protein YhaH (DUF805 family) [Leifsonia sp. 1010]